VHQLNPIWSEEHKQRYIKNVTREYKIHREMRHPRVVDFYDVFEIDVNSFATVLEYCRGIDLDEKYVTLFIRMFILLIHLHGDLAAESFDLRSSFV
jgi:serine/threonine protein kinase